MVKTKNEELCLGLEVTQLQYEVDTRRYGACRINGLPFFGTQIKMDVAFTIVEVWQAVQAVNFFSGQNGKAPGGLCFGTWQGCVTPTASAVSC